MTYVGRLVPVKGVDVLLLAWSKLPSRHQARLLLIGDGPERPRLEAMAEELGLGSTVTFVGHSGDVESYLQSSDVYVQPSRQEGMPNSVLQAMACSLPIVATAISGNMDLVAPSKNGLLVPREDAVALSDALEKLIQDADMRQRMGEASRVRAAESYELQRVLDRLETAYRGATAT